jgi:phosphate transport system permease protein
MKGKLAYAFIFFFAYGIFTATFAFISRGAPAAKDVFISTLVSLGAVLTVLPMASILFTVLQKGLPGLHLGILTNDMSMATSTDPIATGGIH